MKKEESLPNGQEKITKYVLRSRSNKLEKSKENDSQRCSVKKLEAKAFTLRPKRSKVALPLHEIGENEKNAPLVGKRFPRQTEGGRLLKMDESEPNILRGLKQTNGDPYDFDNFMEEYEKENPLLQKKKRTTKAKMKEKTTKGGARKRNTSSMFTAVKKNTGRNLRSKIVLSSTTNIDVQSATSTSEANAKKLLPQIESKITVPCYENDVHNILENTTSPPFTKVSEAECLTSTPQGSENGSLRPCRDIAARRNVSLGNSGLSPIREVSVTHFSQDMDLNLSGFVSGKNNRTYCKPTFDKKCVHRNGNVGPSGVEKMDLKKKKCKGKTGILKNFDKWASSVNNTLQEAEQFELVFE